MEHFPRFRRKKDLVAPPTLITPANDNTTDATARTTTPSPGEVQPATATAAPAAMMRPVQKLSPFRVFHRSSGKRARDSPPASLPHSPTAAAVLDPDSAIADRPVSPMSFKTDATGDHQQEQEAGRAPKIPTFLELSQQEIMLKYQELTWLERSRWMQGAHNPSPDFKWARPQGAHLKKLDRYGNIQPWHNNRVKLQVPEGHIDYINASPITLVPSTHPTSDGRTADMREADRYIAMQGPKQTSTDHVWRMIVEQLESPGVIVMLTETHEGHAEKCFPYFPRSPEDPPLEVNERDEFSDGFRATVRCEGMEETPAGDAIELRKLVIRVHSLPSSRTTQQQGSGGAVQPPALNRSSQQANVAVSPEHEEETDADFDIKMKDEKAAEEEEEFVEERIVWHFLYKKWPDFGVPALADLESFFTLMRLSRVKNAGPHNPRIVHCSAGVGRSGTFIALEHLIRELDAGVLEHYDERLATTAATSTTNTPGGSESANTSPTTKKEEEGEDLIFTTVNHLREQRTTMVQAEIQYLFIYQVMRKLWKDKYGSDGEEGQGEPAAKRLEVDP
ncbi:protein-tyrosine phosphatase-like protein, partial [Apodospora peruviana]